MHIDNPTMVAAMDEIDPLKLDWQVCFPLYAATNLLTRLYRPLLADLGLTYPQYLVMLVLWEEAPKTVGELGGRLHLDSGTLTPLLKRMEAAGLVERRRDMEDERRVLIHLTPQGKALKEPAAKVPLELMKALPDEGVGELRDQLKGLVAMLAAHGGTS